MTYGNIRRRQLEKAKRMVKTAPVKSDSIKNLTPVFTKVVNSFTTLGIAADKASASIANLVPNIRKRG